MSRPATSDTTWRSISRKMARQRPVFVVGLARSGTTALRMALHRLEAFRSVRPTAPESRVFHEPELIARIGERAGRHLFYYMHQDENAAEALRADLESVHPRFSRVREWLALHTDAPGRSWRLRGRHHHVRLYFHHAQTARKSRRILEKSPQHALRMEEIFATFPLARVLMCIRHPVDVFSSLRKRLARDSARGRREERLAWMKVDARQMAGRYRRVARAERRQLERRPDRSALVRYEDLTRDPENELRRLCAFIGEPFDADAMLGEVEEARDAYGSPVKGSRITANEKRWEEWIAPDEAKRLEDLVEPEMQWLDYPRYT